MADQVTLIHADCLDALRQLPSNSIDAIVTDPPYGLTSNGGGPSAKGKDSPHGRAQAGAARGGFMGLKWDSDVPPVEVWAECLRVLKPGGHLLAFAGTRTQHRMATRIEDAGFEIRDLIPWIYASGFPKSRNFAEMDMKGEDSESWKGWGTALKPALEPITLARKPLAGAIAENVIAFGTGALNIDACRVPVDDAAYERNCSGDRGHAGTRASDAEGATNLHTGGGSASSAGRWPANLVHDGSDTVLAQFPHATGQKARVTGSEPTGHGFSGNVYGKPGQEGRQPCDQRDGGGSAARFFYCAKASRSDRNVGLADPGPQFKKGSTLRDAERVGEKREGNFHPTVKPTKLMRYLCRLVTPPGGKVLDPFMGSGSTGRGAVLEGFAFIGIEREAEYMPIAQARIQAAVDQMSQAGKSTRARRERQVITPVAKLERVAEPAVEAANQLSLFGTERMAS